MSGSDTEDPEAETQSDCSDEEDIIINDIPDHAQPSKKGNCFLKYYNTVFNCKLSQLLA